MLVEVVVDIALFLNFPSCRLFTSKMMMHQVVRFHLFDIFPEVRHYFQHSLFLNIRTWIDGECWVFRLCVCLIIDKTRACPVVLEEEGIVDQFFYPIVIISIGKIGLGRVFLAVHTTSSAYQFFFCFLSNWFGTIWVKIVFGIRDTVPTRRDDGITIRQPVLSRSSENFSIRVGARKRGAFVNVAYK